MFKKYVILIAWFAFYVSSSTDYGTFNLVIRKFEICKGPKRRDCCYATSEIINGSTIDYHAVVNESITINKGKIVAMSKNKELLRLQMKNPCDHLFLKPLFQTIMNVTKNCAVSKATYNFKINIQDIAQKYYDGAFLFGNWTFKSIFYGDDCNFSCAIVDVEFTPKNKTGHKN